MEHEEATRRCDVLDVLEEAAHFGRPVRVELRDGASFQARVRDVLTESGEDYVVFRERGRVPVTDIVRCRSTFDHDPHSYDEKL